MATLFRTQDTKANWARKINLLTPKPVPKLREVPQTREQWQKELNAWVRACRAIGVVVPLMLFRLQDTRQMWARKLNRVAKAIASTARSPVNTVAPTITGTAQVGQVLTRTTGTWTGSPTPTYTQQWYANGAAISGATGTTYTPVVGDVGKTITVRVTATNANGSAQKTSAATAAVIAA